MRQNHTFNNGLKGNQYKTNFIHKYCKIFFVVVNSSNETHMNLRDEGGLPHLVTTPMGIILPQKLWVCPSKRVHKSIRLGGRRSLPGYRRSGAQPSCL